MADSTENNTQSNNNGTNYGSSNPNMYSKHNNIEADNTRNNAVRNRIIERYPNLGNLKVQVSTGKGNFPIEGALVEVARNHNGNHYVLYRYITNNSGIVSDIILPANPTAESQSSSTAGGSGVDYIVSVSHPSFIGQENLIATIYNKVGSILSVDLIPLFPAGGVG